MTPEEHNQTLSTIYFIYGALHGLTLIGLLLLVFAVKFAAPSSASLPPSWIVTAVIIFAIVFLAVGLFPVLLGFGFRNRRRWVRPFGLAVAVVSIINIPIGTALGIYTIKFLRSEGGARLYGGSTGSANDQELQGALRGARPLMSWADRLK
ncbi:MAG TPA: hypothetical protein VGU64_03590 [Terriglobales bacterium]|nr:hypothetical protein [Terriglobales bacterium]